MVKHVFRYLRYNIHVMMAFFCDFCYRLCTKSPQIASKKETIYELINKRYSICRFGDGEFTLLEGRDLKFQKYDKELCEKLFSVLRDTHEGVLIGLPDTFDGYTCLERADKCFWIMYMWKNRSRLYQILDRKKYYYNSNISRPYMIYKDKKEAVLVFDLLKLVWNERNVIIVEGEQSRLGVYNDLFENAKSMRRILCPVENAFSKYNEILEAIKQIYEKDDLVLIALGPTATVLALDLHLCGIQALDIGHVDIEYSWMNMKALEKIPVPGKYTNEVGASGGICKDPQYLKEIVKVIVSNGKSC